jgi:hypothetical protein
MPAKTSRHKIFLNLIPVLCQAIGSIIAKATVPRHQDIGKFAISQFGVLKGSWGKTKNTQINLKGIAQKSEISIVVSEYLIPLSELDRISMIPRIK